MLGHLLEMKLSGLEPSGQDGADKEETFDGGAEGVDSVGIFARD